MRERPPSGPGRWTSRVKAVRALSWPNRVLLAESTVALVVANALLRTMTFQRLYGWLSRTRLAARPAAEGAGAALARVRDIADVVSLAARHAPFAGACLQRSIVLWWMLRSRGFDSAIRFGARKVDGTFRAHAWVEFGGQPVGDGDGNAASEYAPMPWLSTGSI